LRSTFPLIQMSAKRTSILHIKSLYTKRPPNKNTEKHVVCDVGFIQSNPK